MPNYQTVAGSREIESWSSLLLSNDAEVSFVYVTIEKRLEYTHKDWKPGSFGAGFVTFSATIDKVLAGSNYKAGEQIIIRQEGGGANLQNPNTYDVSFPGFYLFEPGMKLSLIMMDDVLESRITGEKIDICKVICEPEAGYLDEINGEEYIVFKHCKQDSGDLPIELFNRGILTDKEDLLVTEVDYKTLDAQGIQIVESTGVYIIKASAYEALIAMKNEYYEHPEWVKMYGGNYAKVQQLWENNE